MRKVCKAIVRFKDPKVLDPCSAKNIKQPNRSVPGRGSDVQKLLISSWICDLCVFCTLECGWLKQDYVSIRHPWLIQLLCHGRQVTCPCVHLSRRSGLCQYLVVLRACFQTTSLQYFKSSSQVTCSYNHMSFATASNLTNFAQVQLLVQMETS